jgi:predicted nucleotidyltransferase
MDEEMIDIRSLISSKIRIEILRILALNPETSFNINELCRQTGFAIRGVDKELKSLLSGGILKMEISGNQHRYQLDPRSPINREIKGIITKTVGIADNIRQALKPVQKNIERAFVYGSFASGDYGNESDIDLFIVSNLNGLKLSELLGKVQKETGREINISQFTSEEFNQRIEQKDHFVTSVLESPKINIIGPEDGS